MLVNGEKENKASFIAEQMLGAGSSSDVGRAIWTQSVRARINRTIRHNNRLVQYSFAYTHCQMSTAASTFSSSYYHASFFKKNHHLFGEPLE